MNRSSENQEEILIQGIPASPGVAIGEAFTFTKKSPEVETNRIEEALISDEISLFYSARKNLKSEWQNLLEKENDGESKAIILAQIEIISDPDLAERIESLIKKRQHSAVHAIDKAFKGYIDRLADSGNAMMEERMIDLSDIRDQLVQAAGTNPEPFLSKEGDILVCNEISPREVIRLSHQHIKGFVMEQGGNTSHAAIIARSVGIPAVVGVKGILEKVRDGTTICLDGERGLVSLHPSSRTCKRAEQLQADTTRALEDRIHICEQPSATKDGEEFIIRANVEFLEELDKARQFKAKGVGLLRTESVYLNQEEFGSTEKQVEFYDQILSETNDDCVVIRLFDVGGDKFQGTKIAESNPFLGWRGIRMLLDERDILREQLRAIMITAGKDPGRVKLLVPMLSTLEEVKLLKEEISQCCTNLADEGYAIDQNVPLGIMVEIPSVAIQAEHFAPEVDFFSIGTNDLTQYLLAVDRGNALISELYDQAHPSMWKLINYVTDVADENDIPVDVCGELAAKPIAAACLLGVGVSSLSMSPVHIPSVKQLLLKCTRSDFEELAKRVLACRDIEEVETVFNEWEKNLE